MVDSQGTWRAFSGWTSLWAGGRVGDSEGKRCRHASVTDIGEGEVIVRGEPHSRFLSSTSCNLVKGSLIDHLIHQLRVPWKGMRGPALMEWIQRRKGVM